MTYLSETIPNHIKMVKDTYKNRDILREILGDPKLLYNEFAYIEVNLIDKTWRSTFSYEWLYRNQPTLISIEELKQYLTQDEQQN